MKIKCRPEDFEVEELTDVAPGAGPVALYRLTKKSLGTPEVVQAVVERWKIERRRISYGGLKDRHALTRQYVTIDRGPRNDLKQDLYSLQYLGQADRPFTPREIRGNRFRVVVRDMAPPEAAVIQEALAEAKRSGLPNYYDDQRFGSLGESGEFVAQSWCKGDYERALWLALADPNEHDRPDDRKEKKTLRDLWGTWPECKAALGRSHRRSIVTFLADRPGDFRGALARVNVDLRSLYLSAFQSHLWNRLLAATLRGFCPPDRLVSVELKSDRLLFPRELKEGVREELLRMTLPLPSARAKIGDEGLRRRVEEVVRGAGLEMAAMKIKHPKGNFFSRGDRAAWFEAEGLAWREGEDELYKRRRKLTLTFDLPRGSYATILIKRVTLL